MNQEDLDKLAGMFQSMINKALSDAGIIMPVIEPEEEIEEEEIEIPTPEYVITVNGAVVGATIADDEELDGVIASVREVNKDAVIKVYVLDEDIA